MAVAPCKIILIDDRSNDSKLASLILQGVFANAEIRLIDGAVTFAEVYASGDFDLVVTEQNLSWASGRDILHSVKRRYPRCPVIFLTSLSDPRFAMDAAKGGLDDYIRKDSAGFLQLASAVRRLLPDGSLPGRSLVSETRPEAASVLERLPVGIFGLSRDGRIDCGNPACRQLFGLGEAETRDAPRLQDLFSEGPDKDRLVEALSDVQSEVEIDGQLYGVGGRWLRVSLWPLGDKSGEEKREGSVVDISSYQEALNRLAVRTEELSRSNSDLERFAYVASHDLQEPLSYISRYAGLLLERYDANGDPDARQYLSHISDSAQRLQSMVDDILTYSRLSRQGESFAAVDFGEAADAAASTLEDTFQETHAVLERGPLPTLDADRMQIQQLFRNLFSNSLKFRGENPPTIRVLAREEAGYWRFSVKDNGIGIEPEGINEIFGMFRRLHTSKEYSGTGVGLAICQSIVERHGGKIWAESEPGKGATIYFTIKAGRQSVPLPDADGRLPV